MNTIASSKLPKGKKRQISIVDFFDKAKKLKSGECSEQTIENDGTTAAIANARVSPTEAE